jgi:hypothetical protein
VRTLGHRSTCSARLLVRCWLVVCGVFAVAGLVPGVAGAVEVEAPGWEVTAVTYPTRLVPGGSGVVSIQVFDIGAAASAPGAMLTDVLPAHLAAVSGGGWECSSGVPETCTYSLPSILGGAQEPAAKEPPKSYPLRVTVLAGAGESGPEVDRVTVAGGGAPSPASASVPVVVSATPAGFGIADWTGWFSNANGTLDTQAGSHPYEATFALAVNTAGSGEQPEPAGGDLRSVLTELPAGLIANPNAVAQCTREEFNVVGGGECPADSQVGVAVATLAGIVGMFPVYNMVPPAGLPAQLGFELEGIHTFIDPSVRSGSDYGIDGNIEDIVQEGREIVDANVTLWGEPGDPTHDPQRCTFMENEFHEVGNRCGLLSGVGRVPFLTLPTSCGGPLSTNVAVREWENPAAPLQEASFQTPAVTGCEHLAFSPAISLAPESSYTDTPAGLSVDVHVPQEGLGAVEGLAMADIQDTTVTLPEGLVINPGQAAGLAACGEPESALGTEAAPSCPAASKVGEVSIRTPLLEGAPEKELRGNVYVLRSEPPDIKILLAASGDGVNVKLAGDVRLDEQTGRLTSTFTGTPQIPFSDLELTFNGGAQAALATPTQCGNYTTDADFTPWSSPFLTNALLENTFQTTAGTSDTECPGFPLSFSPTLSAGTTSEQAGENTSFVLQLQRGDDQQRIQGLSITMPPGLGATLTGVALCGEPQAEKGECPAASQIGHASVASGPGSYPLVLPQPGDPEIPVYLTGPYQGAPFGLSIPAHIIAGPFDLGTIVTRAKIEVDPRTAQITVTTSPLPQIIKGVPTSIRAIDSVITRPNFMFDPTNCSPLSITGTATGAQPPNTPGPSDTSPIESRFQVGGCRGLVFTPKFTATTSGKTSKADGASLTTTLSYPITSQGTEANITRVKVELPKQLPSRNTTLQKACLAKQFEANPAGCPPGAIIGQATVTTPVLPVPLTGPAYFVSYGGEKFPALVMILQGYGITLKVTGNTFISKAGITSTTFQTVPDQPFTTFTLTLPQGPDSALAANTNLCTTKLTMPTELTAQNGTQTNQNTSITVTNCPKKHKTKPAKKHGTKYKKNK